MADELALPELLLKRARGGDPDGLSELLEMYRNYLRLLARTQMGPGLRGRLEPSDLVQEALLEAHRDFQRFAGLSEKELLVWLRRILVRNLMDQVKHHQAQVRDYQRQQSLEAMLEGSSHALERALAAGSSPSTQASRREQAVLLADALERLPEDYREVIVLRNLQHLKFDDIAARMGRSAGAVTMLWARALERLSPEMGGRATPIGCSTPIRGCPAAAGSWSTGAPRLTRSGGTPANASGATGPPRSTTTRASWSARG